MTVGILLDSAWSLYFTSSSFSVIIIIASLIIASSRSAIIQLQSGDSTGGLACAKKPHVTINLVGQSVTVSDPTIRWLSSLIA